MSRIVIIFSYFIYFLLGQECEDIEYSYDQLHSGVYSECEFNIDCMAVWGDCDVGLGGCHYAINEERYDSMQVDTLVNMWIEDECVSGVCDCTGLPSVQCINSYCELAYCYDLNPEGCFSSGCPDGYECIDDPHYCVPSSCFCSGDFYGEWFCDDDCNGGTCIEIENQECSLTTEDILGPYYFEDAPFRNIIAHEDEPGQRLFISGTVKQNDCEQPISGSLIEIWQANDEGCYGIIEDCDTGNPNNDYFNLRGKLFSDENGEYSFESILPGYYGSRPRHIHIKITTPSEEVLVSQLYFENDPNCESDPWCQDADDRIIVLEENQFGLHGEIDLIMDSLNSGIISGDINFDNLINVQDIVLLVGIIVDNFTSSDFQVYSGDLNSDNYIDVLDIVQLVNIILN